MPPVKKIKKAAPVKVKAAPKKAGLSADLYNLEGKKSGTIDLPKEIFGVKASDNLLAQAVRVYLANQRSGTQSTQSRGEVTGSTHKIYRQKGTGRARHGSRKAPIFVGGGVAFGPRPRNHSLKLNKKQKSLAVKSALTLRFKAGDILFVDKLLTVGAKTGALAKILKNLSVNPNQNSLLIYPIHESDNLTMAARNIGELDIIPIESINTYSLLKPRKIIFAKEGVEILTKQYATK